MRPHPRSNATSFPVARHLPWRRLFHAARRAAWLAGIVALPLVADAASLIAPDPAPAQFAVQEIQAALVARHDSSDTRIVLATVDDETALKALADAGGTTPTGLLDEGFSIQRTDRPGDATTIWVLGADMGGVMYGGLELAGQIRAHGLPEIEPMQRNPHIALRGVKFNIPLDLRTPSYTDMSDAAQANIGTVWDFSFWTAFLDQLARDRYNFVSLWNLHPFPSLVKVPEYPDIALDDVLRSTIKFDEDYSTRTEDIVTPAMLAQTETVRKLTIDEKIDFWRRVMQYGRDRNIDFHVITWNTYTYGTGGKHDISDALDNPVTRDYFRASVRALFKTYPLLRGIGVTAGENMGHHGSSFDIKEEWLFATYGQAVLDIAREQPGRRIRFIHRQHETRGQDIARLFAPLVEDPDIEFVFSFKYAQAHVMSSTTQPFHHEFVAGLRPTPPVAGVADPGPASSTPATDAPAAPLRTLWTLRNDDALMFRWGAPDFVREFIANMPHDVTAGLYYGSDMWVWGREFLSLDPESPRQLETAKHWLNWMLWGRLAYDPTLDNGEIAALIAHRFPEAATQAHALLDAWQHASMIYPLTTGFHWGQYDFQWYIEGCRSRPGPAETASGFHDVNRFITLPPHPGTDNIGIPRFVEATLNGESLLGTTPPRVAATLRLRAGAALATVDTIDPGSNEELRATLDDIRCMAYLGHYYAWKITGATELALFRKTRNPAHQSAAVAALTSAADKWSLYTALAAKNYKNPFWTNRVGIVDWTELTAEVARDIEIARQTE